jgi:hypothetical protein
MNSVLWILAALAAPVISAAAPVSFAASAATPSPVPAPAPSQVPVPAPAPQPTSTSPPPTSACNLNATTSNFARQVAAATAGQVICLASGNYGTWTGTNKAITVTKQSGAMVTMGIDFTTGNNGFTIDGLTIAGGRIINGAKNITIKNSAFTTNHSLQWRVIAAIDTCKISSAATITRSSPNIVGPIDVHLAAFATMGRRRKASADRAGLVCVLDL